MDQQVYDLVGWTIPAATVIAVVYAKFKHDYLAKKADLETRAARLAAAKELFESSGFKEYLKQRTELYERLLGDGQTHFVGDSTNEALGKMPLFDKLKF